MENSALARQLRALNYDALPISDYNLRYIRRLLPALDYYLDIYSRGLKMMLSRVSKPPQELTLVDYGGGHGFLSLLAKQQGFRQVVYTDYNPDAVATIQTITDHLGFGPDVMLCGDIEVLRQWCERENEVPDIVMGMDVIEHIYCLDDFFSNLFSISNQMQLLFTTASTPYNRRVVHRLRQAMRDDELGHPASKNRRAKQGFRSMRRQIIAEQHPDFSDNQLTYWAAHTRGLKYDDILRAVESETPNLLRDPYNTCHPITGSWTERILPISDYRNLLLPYNYRLHIVNGFYNTHRNTTKGKLSRFFNRCLSHACSRHLAPFLYFIVTPDHRNPMGGLVD